MRNMSYHWTSFFRTVGYAYSLEAFIIIADQHLLDPDVHLLQIGTVVAIASVVIFFESPTRSGLAFQQLYYTNNEAPHDCFGGHALFFF